MRARCFPSRARRFESAMGMGMGHKDGWWGDVEDFIEGRLRAG